MTIEQARDDLTAVHKAMIPEFEVNEISSPVVHSLRDRYLGDYRLGSAFLLGSVAIVLLIACANIAALMFARSLARGSGDGGACRDGSAPGQDRASAPHGEPGARRHRRCVRGLRWASGGPERSSRRCGSSSPAGSRSGSTSASSAFTVAVTAAAAVFFGLAPALQASAGGATVGVGRATASRSRRRTLAVLVAGEVALAMVLLVVGSLTVLDVRRLAEVDPGLRGGGADRVQRLALPFAAVRE